MWPFKRKKKEMRLTFLSPSSSPLAVGNGELGVFLSGGVGLEHCMVYANTMDSHSEQNMKSLNQLDAKKNVDRIKKEIGLGNLSVAENIMTKSLLDAGFVDCDKPSTHICDIDIVYHRVAPAVDYRRVLDMENACFTVSFADREGMEYRDSFVSNDSGIFCYRAYRDRGSIDCEIRLSNITNQYTLQDINGYLVIKQNSKSFMSGFVLGAVASDGAVSILNNALHIKSSSRMYVFGQQFYCKEEDVDSVVLAIIDRLSKSDVSFDRLFKDSRAVFAKKMNMTNIDFSPKEVENVDIEILLGKYNALSQDMMDLLYKYGKYLAFSLGQVAVNTQSFLIDDSYTDEYLSVARDMLGLLKFGSDSEMVSLMRGIYDNMETFKQNAHSLYNATGIFVPSKADSKGLVMSSSPTVLLNKIPTFVTGMMAYELYKRNNDQELNNILIEIIQSCADFFVSFFKKDKNSKVYYSPFGISPFSKSGQNDEMISNNCTCDYVCARYLLNALQTIKDDKKNVEYLNAIPDIVVNKDGSVKEYDLPQGEKVVPSPYLSYLLPYILGVKNIFGKREYESVLSNSIKSKYVSSFGMLSSSSLVDMALGLATLSESRDSYEFLSLLSRTFMMNNLMFTASDHSYMAVGKMLDKDCINIDVNVAVAQTLQNMLINQSGDNVYLPNSFATLSLPIRAKSIMLENSLLCNIDLNARKGVIKITFSSKKGAKFTLHLPQTYKRHKCKVGLLDRENLKIDEFVVEKNKPQKIVIYF